MKNNKINEITDLNKNLRVSLENANLPVEVLNKEILDNRKKIHQKENDLNSKENEQKKLKADYQKLSQEKEDQHNEFVKLKEFQDKRDETPNQKNNPESNFSINKQELDQLKETNLQSNNQTQELKHKIYKSKKSLEESEEKIDQALVDSNLKELYTINLEAELETIGQKLNSKRDELDLLKETNLQNHNQTQELKHKIYKNKKSLEESEEKVDQALVDANLQELYVSSLETELETYGQKLKDKCDERETAMQELKDKYDDLKKLEDKRNETSNQTNISESNLCINLKQELDQLKKTNLQNNNQTQQLRHKIYKNNKYLEESEEKIDQALVESNLQELYMSCLQSELVTIGQQLKDKCDELDQLKEERDENNGEIKILENNLLENQCKDSKIFEELKINHAKEIEKLEEQISQKNKEILEGNKNVTSGNVDLLEIVDVLSADNQVAKKGCDVMDDKDIQIENLNKELNEKNQEFDDFLYTFNTAEIEAEDLKTELKLKKQEIIKLKDDLEIQANIIARIRTGQGSLGTTIEETNKIDEGNLFYNNSQV